MDVSRRQLLKIVGGAVASSPTVARATPVRRAAPPVGLAGARADFPRLARKLWLAAAEYHPISVHSLRAMESYARFRALGPGADRETFTAERQAETKASFAKLINAEPHEIAFVQSTTDGENLVVAGMDLARQGGNVVIDDLHFVASKFLYHMLQEQGGIELRVVRHRNWKIRVEDMARAIDRNTRLVSMALVSNINGYLHDVKAVSDLAHAHGAYVYADVIQAAGATPVDVRAMGIDCCASSSYKWLMGDFGLGFLYVREDLQDRVVRRSRYGTRQIQRGSAFESRPGAARYEMSTLSNSAGVCVHEGLKYILGLGVDSIRAHVKPLTDRLQAELPPLGYPSITPADSPTPIVSFLTPDPEAVQAKLDRAFGEHVVSNGRRWELTDEAGATRSVVGMRVAPSVYNNQADIDAFLDALA